MNDIRLHQPENIGPSPTRSIAGLDLLRAGAALAVVMLHAGVPYLKHPMPGLIWSTRDGESVFVDGVFWAIEVMIMPLFLVIAGFFLWRSAGRLSPAELVRSRAKRLLIPLGFGLLVVLPLDLYIWTAGLVADGVVDPVKLKSFKFDAPIADQIWGLSHLWFLLYVFLYVVIAAAALRLMAGRKSGRFVDRVSQPMPAGTLLAIAAAATLVSAPEVVWGFQHAFVPVPSKWIYSGLFFAAGVLLAVHDSSLGRARLYGPRVLAIGVVLLTAAVAIGIWHLEWPGQQTTNQAASVVLACVTVGAAATVTFGMIGTSVRFINQVPEVVRYVAAASFWIYLVHHPLLGLVHLDLKWVWPGGSAESKFLISFTAATAIALLTYESFVRTTRLGTLLGFGYQPQRKRPVVHSIDDRPAETTVREERVEPDRRRAA